MNNIIELKSAEFIFVSGGKRQEPKRLPKKTQSSPRLSLASRLSLPSVSTMIIIVTLFQIASKLITINSLLNKIYNNIPTYYEVNPNDTGGYNVTPALLNRK